jgi:uncharacterized Zn finger protein
MAFYGRFPEYEPVAQRLARGQREVARRVAARGRPAAPVIIEGREIARTVWGKGWCEHLEKYSDQASRLPRGRTYVRNGSVLDVDIVPGAIHALVIGSELYQVDITIAPVEPAAWQELIAACAGKIGSLIGLLRGELSPEVLAVLTRKERGLFPASREITMRCSCPDAAGLCKHLAAVLYGVGNRLDQAPELLFTLRQVQQDELVAGATRANVLEVAGAGGQGKRKRLDGADLGAVFGIELEPAPGKTGKRKRRDRL